MNYKNLLFDLGGVIMDIKKENCIAAFERLGLPDAASYFGDYGQQGVFMAIERGDISVEQFHQALREVLPAGTTDQDIDHAFNQFLIGIPTHRLRQLEDLRRLGYRIYLLSNTNRVMWDATIRSEFEKDGHTMQHYFDGIVTSFEARALKPDAEIFRYAERTLGIKPEETLFFDDSQANLDGAALLGFNTALVRPGDEFIDLISTRS